MMKNWTICVPVAAAVVLMVCVGYVQGVWSERWATFPELKIFAEQLQQIPKQIGEWQGTDAEGSDERILKIAGAEGELNRLYRNGNGEEVRISIICGRLQDVTYHTPDRCYKAAGYEIQSDKQREVIELPGGVAEFFAANFTKSEATGTHAERTYWSWSGDGKWKAPDNEKFAFASHQRALYKLYVFSNIPADAKKASEQKFAEDFIRIFIPAINEALRPAFEKVGRTSEAPKTAAAAPEAAPAG